ncbi:MAG: hypothetical protein AAF804_05705 [Bacteroidota bacterium]
MGTFTTKKLRLRSRAEKRRRALKPSPKTFGLKESYEQKNLEVIRSLESKVKAIQAEQQAS